MRSFYRKLDRRWHTVFPGDVERRQAHMVGPDIVEKKDGADRGGNPSGHAG
jgi:hypothetical protein